MKQQLGEFVSVSQFDGDHGPVRNQFIIRTSLGEVFQSYNTIIAARVYCTDKSDTQFGKRQILLDCNSWDCSVTTGKYRNKFLGENKTETQRRIKNKEYILCELN